MSRSAPPSPSSTASGPSARNDAPGGSPPAIRLISEARASAPPPGAAESTQVPPPRLDRVGQHLHGGRLGARGQPMDHVDRRAVLRRGRARAGQQRGRAGAREVQVSVDHRPSLPETAPGGERHRRARAPKR